MLKHYFSGTIATLLLSAMPLMAKDAAAPAAAPAAPPELAQLAIFHGTWSCTGKAFASPMGPEHATEATVHGTNAVGDRWVHVAYEEKKTAANPMPFHAGIYMGFDSGKKKFVEGCFDGMGGYCTQTSSGWDGDTMVFEGTASGGEKSSGARDTFVKKGANELTHTGSMQGDDKQWVKTDEETCHKAK